MAPPRIPIEQRFWAKVEQRQPDECWPWRGYRNARGYGRIASSGGLHHPAHRVAWEVAHGQPFPSGKHACHRCDNPGCVNPAHIFPATNRENMLDAARKRRIRNGAGLMRSAAEVREIRAAAATGKSVREIAADYGVHRTTIFMIVSRKTYAYFA